ncbi:MAG TPA: CoA transferase [Dehalococcoidia bacterium]|nr:CoA transferase [Dehalococcoidia bacterium]
MYTGALEGIRVADFSLAWAGAYTSTLLTYLGAEVIKIESSRKPDHTRRFSMSTSAVFEGLDRSPIFNDINTNKLSVTIELSQPKGIELAKKLASVCDVVTQNMRPGVMERLGLSYEELKKVKPDIIYLSSSLRGSTGPERNYGGYAPNFAAVSGLSNITGYADDLPAGFMGEIDLMSATTAALGILAALNYRSLTGRGQHIDLSSSDAITALMGDVILDYTVNGRVQSRNGNVNGFMAPHNCYRCKGEDKWVSIVIASDEEWDDFCAALGNPEWAKEERFGDIYTRWQNQDELDRLIEEWTVNHTDYEVMEKLQKSGIAAVPSFSSMELCTDPHLEERSAWVEVNHPIIGKQTVTAPPWKLSVTPAQVYRPGPLLGEHNQYIFGELLGMSSTEIDRFIEEKVIY